jgi:hypothetical protein
VLSRRAAWLVVLVVLLAPTVAAAQTPGIEQPAPVLLVGEADGRAVRLAREILARGKYVLIERDTVLGADFHAPADLIVADATVRLEGAVEGSVAVLGGELFVRPGARIGGASAAIGGAVYPSGLAEMGPVYEAEPGTEVTLEPTDSAFVVRLAAPASAPRWTPAGIYGVRLPTYDRVSGATVGWGGEWRVADPRKAPAIGGWAEYYTARGTLGGGARLRVPLGRLEMTLTGARQTLTNERWARGDLSNTLGALVAGRDYRDYYEADYAALSLSRPAASPGQGGLAFTPRLTLLAERSRSLVAREPWSLSGRGGLARENLPVDPGDLVSLSAGATLGWLGGTSEFAGSAAVEYAPAAWSDLAFTQARAEGEWEMQALWGHTITLFGYAQRTLGSKATPQQRWSFVGGSPTLPTFDVAAFRGDNVVYLRSRYDVPLNFIAIPLLGSPALGAEHAIGTAWRPGHPMPAWEQNLGAGIRFPLIDAFAYLDPAAAERKITVSIGLNLPF